MKRKKILVILCCITLGVSMILGGCQKTATSDTTSGKTEDKTDSSETTIYGQISNIDGNTITIALAETPQMQEGSTEMQPGEAPDMKEGSTEMQPGEAPQKSDGSTESQGEAPQKPEDSTESQGEAPAMPEGSTEMLEGSTEMQQNGKGSGQPGGGGMGISLTGEEQTITISDSTVINIQSGSDTKEGTADDLAKEDIVTVVMNGDTVESITVGGGMASKNK